jgi:hypothetical protein
MSNSLLGMVIGGLLQGKIVLPFYPLFSCGILDFHQQAYPSTDFLPT